jgi:hypothetical protein
LLHKLGVGKESGVIWAADKAPPPQEHEIHNNQGKRSMFQKIFKVDTMVYPISGSTALLYMIVGLIFAFSGAVCCSSCSGRVVAWHPCLTALAD